MPNGNVPKPFGVGGLGIHGGIEPQGNLCPVVGAGFLNLQGPPLALSGGQALQQLQPPGQGRVAPFLGPGGRRLLGCLGHQLPVPGFKLRQALNTVGPLTQGQGFTVGQPLVFGRACRAA
jgi:hypothetical protein